MEGAAVELRLVGDVVDRRGDVVDRDDVDLAAFDPDRRQPRGQHPPRPLQRLEEVVGPVDLVDLAGARVADHDPRPVDPPGPRAFLADQPLGLVLGAEVGVVVEPLGLVEHVLAPLALVEAGGGDRADLVEAAGLDRAGELDRVPGALDVGDLLRFGVGGDVVDRRQVEEVVDLAAHRHQVLLGDAEAGLGEVAGDRDDARPVGAPAGPQLLQPAARSGPHQGVDRALALQQTLDQVAADESGCAGDEVAHRVPGYLDSVAQTPGFIDSDEEMPETATVQIAMPEMGESVTEGIVLEWHVAEGDFVNEGDTVVEVSTDKVDAEVPAPTSGVITKLLASVDDEVPVGAPLAEMEAGEGSGGSAAGPAAAAEPACGRGRGFARASPRGAAPAGGWNGAGPAAATAAPMSGRRRWRGRVAEATGVDLGFGQRDRARVRRSPKRMCSRPATAAAMAPLPAAAGEAKRCAGRRRCWPRRWTRAGRCRPRPRSGRSPSTRSTPSARRSTWCSKSAG